MQIGFRLIPAACAAGFLALSIAACAQTTPAQKVDTYEATLSGAQEVPAVSTSGTGAAEVQLNTGTNKLSWKVTYSGLSGPASAGHIHGPAAAGQNAGVVIPFSNIGTQPVSGETSVTPQQIADLEAGRWYVNVHTAAHPAGEIRGQLRRRQ